jgi:hypothetical protein
VYGRRGSGKTTRVLLLIRDRPRVVVFDPTGEFEREHGVTAFCDGDALRLYLARHWQRGFRVAFTPRANYEREQLHALATFLLACQRPYLDGADARTITLVVEEMNLGYPAQGLPQHLDGMSRVCNQGRHYGIEVIGVTQRPPLVSATFRGGLAETWIFPLARADDRGEVLNMLGRQWGDQLAALQAHHCLHYHNGAVRRDANPAPRP